MEIIRELRTWTIGDLLSSLWVKLNGVALIGCCEQLSWSLVEDVIWSLPFTVLQQGVAEVRCTSDGITYLLCVISVSGVRCQVLLWTQELPLSENSAVVVRLIEVDEVFAQYNAIVIVFRICKLWNVEIKMQVITCAVFSVLPEV